MTGEPKVILVADDSRMVRMEIREELEKGGYEIIEAKNGLEALVLAASSTPPDLITLDIEMPKMNGFETCRRLREERYTRFFTNSRDHHLPVIFITSNDTMKDRRKGFEIGAINFITKPFQKGEVLAVVDKILKPSLSPKGLRALVADDSLVARMVAAEFLEREGIEVVAVEDGERAYEVMKTEGEKIDIVITDMIMPKMDGNRLCMLIRKELGLTDIPIIFLTAVSELSELLDVFKVGASDYLVKPFAKEELLARVNVHIERNRINKQLRDTIQQLKEANEKIEKLSILDSLTGCYNRGYLNSQIPKEIKHSIRYGSPLSIILSDIDHFKQVNDSYGHQFGDEVLIKFVETIQNFTRKELDWVVRFGGEEFLIVLPETSTSDAGIVAEKLRKAVAAIPFHYKKEQVGITASFGVTGFEPYSQSGDISLDQFVKEADKNLYQAKEEGRDRVVSCPLSMSISSK
jgi:two-component system cell cycle response regulator